MQFSLLIPTHPRGPLGYGLLPFCFASLLRQTYQDWEAFVLVDPGHENEIGHAIEEGEQIAHEEGTPVPDDWQRRILVTRCTDPRVWAKLNHGIGLSTGQFIGRIDDDDWYGPTYLETVNNWFASDPARLVIVSVCGVSTYNLAARKYEELNCSYGGGVHMFRRGFLGTVPGYPDPVARGMKVHSEDTAWAHDCKKAGYYGTKCRGTSAIGQNYLIMRFGVGHFWPGGDAMAQCGDSSGNWLRCKVGSALAVRYAAIQESLKKNATPS